MASIRRHPVSGHWNVRYRDPAGRQRSKTFRRQVDAKAFMLDVEVDKRRGTFIDPQAGQTTFAVYSDRWLASRVDRARSTLDRDGSYLRSMILPYFGERAVASIRTSEIVTWVATLDRAETTRTKALQIVRSVLELARRDRAVAINPATEVKPPGNEPARTGRALTDTQVGSLLAAAETIDETSAPIVWLMARAGLRIGEALAVSRDDVDFAAGTLSVTKTMTRQGDLVATKGRKRIDQGRVIPIPQDLADRLRRHIDQTPASISGLLSAGPRGGQMRYTNWRRRQWIPTTVLAGVDANPHDLRHTCATRLFVVDRWGPAEVQHFLGHRDPRVTLAIYTHISTDELPTPSSLTG